LLRGRRSLPALLERVSEEDLEGLRLELAGRLVGDNGRLPVMEGPTNIIRSLEKVILRRPG